MMALLVRTRETLVDDASLSPPATGLRDVCVMILITSQFHLETAGCASSVVVLLTHEICCPHHVHVHRHSSQTITSHHQLYSDLSLRASKNINIAFSLI